MLTESKLENIRAVQENVFLSAERILPTFSQ